MKQNRLLGVAIGITLTLAMLLLSLSSVLTSEAFYLEEEDRYSLTEAMSLESFDDFYIIEQQAQAGFSGKTIEESGLFSAADSAHIKSAGIKLLVIRIILVLAIMALCVALFFTVKKHKRQCMRSMGISACIAAVALCAILNILLLNASPLFVWNIVFPYDASGIAGILFSESFAHDLIFGAVKFFDFLMIIPMGVSYLLVHFSHKPKVDVNEDYMYQ